jgi:Beta-galactosidase
MPISETPQRSALATRFLALNIFRQVTIRVLLGVVFLAPGAFAAGETDSTKPILDLVTSAEAKAQRLAGKLDACRAAGQDIAYPDAALAVAQIFCRFSRYDAGHPALREAAMRSMTYVGQMLDAELRKADEVLAGRTNYPVIPPWRSAIGATWHDGVFWSGGRPIFLSGFNWDASEARHDPALLKRLGVNLTDGMLQGSMQSDGSFRDADFKDNQGRYLGQMDASSLAVDCLLGVNPPRWMMIATPGLAQRGYGNGFNYVIEHPQAAAYREQVLDHYVPLYAAQPSFFAVDLANEPAFQGPSTLMFEHWRAWLRRKYDNLAALNRAWGTQFESFQAIDRFPSEPKVMRSQWDRAAVDFSKPGARGMHYDWCAFNNERISDFFGSLSARIHAHAPRVATHVKVMLGNYFTGSTEERGWRMDLSYHTFGVDPEALARSCSLLGGDVDLFDLSDNPKPNRRYGSVPYIIDWLDAALAADFLKSLAPAKPFYDSEFHVTRDDQAVTDAANAKAHIETALWLAHLHGMSANLAWYWSRASDGSITGASWFKGSLLQQPWMLQGYAQETLSLRRFVGSVAAFARQPRPVRLLYSEASAIQDVAYLDALRDAYEALNFLGVSIGMVTERQLAEPGVPAGTRLVIVPDARYVQDQTVAALRTARARGIAVGIIGERSLTSLPTGGRREDAQIRGAERMGIGTPQDYQRRFEAWLKTAGVEPELAAVDVGGRLAWGIEVRTAREGGRRLAYLVNLMRQPVKVTLRWRVADAHLRDWRTETAIGTEITLAPRQLIFGSF